MGSACSSGDKNEDRDEAPFQKATVVNVTQPPPQPKPLKVPSPLDGSPDIPYRDENADPPPETPPPLYQNGKPPVWTSTPKPTVNGNLQHVVAPRVTPEPDLLPPSPTHHHHMNGSAVPLPREEEEDEPPTQVQTYSKDLNIEDIIADIAPVHQVGRRSRDYKMNS